MIKRAFFIVLVVLMPAIILAQSGFTLPKGGSERIKFKLINNLIVFPVEINGVELSFLLDTGVSKPIIFNFLNINEALQINQAERIYLRGLGEGEAVEAIRSSNNIFKIGDAINIKQDLYAVFDPSLNFAPRLGVPIHGIIGYDLFRDFVVEINYSKSYIRLYEPEDYNEKSCKKCVDLDLDFFNNKPYIDSVVELNGREIPVKLLLDSGGSDSLWLFEDEEKGIKLPKLYFDDFLGRGLSGKVYGKRSRVSSFSIDEFKLRNVNVAFPDSVSITFARKFKERSGSISGNIMKRFNIIFDYRNNKVSFKKNRYFSDPFYYNKSGIELEHNGVRVVRETNKDLDFRGYGQSNPSVAQQTIIVSGTYKYTLAPAFTIVELRENSPAKKAGLELGDVLLTINGRHVHQYSLQEVIQMFYAETGKRIRLLIDRKGVQMKYEFRLEDLL